MRAISFSSVLTDALNEFAEYGYNSEQRLGYWIGKLREAAAAELKSPYEADEEIRKSLGAIFRRLEKSGFARNHKGIKRYTIARVGQDLAPILERRIQASADLIRIHRKESIEKVLQRFQGLATSIPAGGSRAIDKRSAKASIGKSLRQMRFEERRVVIDQGHKLISNIDQTIAEAGGAIAMVWHSHWRQKGYHYREDHKERDEHVYAIRGNWAITAGYMKKGAAGYLDEITQTGEEPFCFPGESKIQFAYGVEKAYRRWFSGELTEIVMASGKTLRGTFNHPVLTVNGWVPLGKINEGDNIIEIADNVGKIAGAFVSELNHDNGVPLISEIFGSVHEAGNLSQVSGMAHQFHGDGMANHDVDIVSAARPLSFGYQSDLPDSGQDFQLAPSNHARSGSGSLEFFGHGCRASLTRLMGCLSAFAVLVGRFVFGNKNVGFCLPPGGNPEFGKSAMHNGPRHPQIFGYRKHAFARIVPFSNRFAVQSNARRPIANDFRVKVDNTSIAPSPKCGRVDANFLSYGDNGQSLRTQIGNVVKVGHRQFSGHVYNLQTTDGWYVTEGIITHNCRCYGTYLYNLEDLPPEMLTKKGVEHLR